MPDERLGEKVCVYVVLVEGAAPLSLKELTDFLKEHNVATQKLPERLELIARLPMTATGKVQKHVLRQDITAKLG
jgi:cyclohexanecarboxylate-CoA ligase